MNIVHCAICKKMPHELSEYVELAEENGTTPAEEATQDGTYNRNSGAFYCTGCYIAIGMPNGKAP